MTEATREVIRREYDDIKVGEKASITKLIREEDVETFADVSEDCNPIHLDEEFAKESLFGQRIAHGILGAGLISAVIGTKLPGVDTIYMGQNLRFTAPVFINDEITASVEVMEKDDERNRIKLKTTVTNQDGKEVIQGDALVMKK